jgi:hypothetical protein
MTDEVPAVGASFVDGTGSYWRVQDVTTSERLAGFYLVRLAYGPTQACDAGRFLLTKREYLALRSEKALRPVKGG